MDLKAPLLGAPPRAAASSQARALLLELTRVHPLLHAGAALLAFTALTAMLSGGVMLAMLLASPAEPAPRLPDWILAGGDEVCFRVWTSHLACVLTRAPCYPRISSSRWILLIGMR